MVTFELPKTSLSPAVSWLRISSSTLEHMLEELPLHFGAKSYTAVLSGPTNKKGEVIGMCIDLYPASPTPECSVNRNAPTIARVHNSYHQRTRALTFHYTAPWHGYKITVHRHPQ